MPLLDRKRQIPPSFSLCGSIRTMVYVKRKIEINAHINNDLNTQNRI